MKTILALCLSVFAFVSTASAAPVTKATASHEEVKVAISNAVAAGVISERAAEELNSQQEIMTPGELAVLLWNLSKAAAYALGDLSWNTVKCIYDLATYAQCPFAGSGDEMQKCFAEKVTPNVKKNCAGIQN